MTPDDESEQQYDKSVQPHWWDYPVAFVVAILQWFGWRQS